MPIFQAVSSDHIGGRAEQQDAVAFWTNDHACLAVVADGVGGNAGGEAASQCAIESAAKHWKKFGGTFDSPKEQLTSIAEDANQAIVDLAKNLKRNPASTLVALYVDQDTAHWVHCGDSRLYWLRDPKKAGGKEMRRTCDHSVVQMLLDQNKITEAELSTHPDKGRILKALGSIPFKGLDYFSTSYQAGDTFLLCTDGYWESIPEGQAVLPVKSENMSLQMYANRMVGQAVKNNGPESDNTSLVIVHTTEGTKKEIAETPTQGKSASSNKGLKNILLIFFCLFILFDILLILYLFVLK